MASAEAHLWSSRSIGSTPRLCLSGHPKPGLRGRVFCAPQAAQINQAAEWTLPFGFLEVDFVLP
jgi:hypothetical protein